MKVMHDAAMTVSRMLAGKCMTACAGFRTFHTYVVVLQEAGGGGPFEGLRSFHKTLSGALNLLRFERWFSSSFGPLDTHNVSRQPNSPGNCNAVERRGWVAEVGKWLSAPQGKAAVQPALLEGPGRF